MINLSRSVSPTHVYQYFTSLALLTLCESGNPFVYFCLSSVCVSVYHVSFFPEWMNEWMFILLSYEGYFYEWEQKVYSNNYGYVVDCREIRWLALFYSRTIWATHSIIIVQYLAKRTSQTGVSEMVLKVGNVVTVIYGIIHSKPSFFGKIMTSNGFIHENC